MGGVRWRVKQSTGKLGHVGDMSKKWHAPSFPHSNDTPESTHDHPYRYPGKVWWGSQLLWDDVVTMSCDEDRYISVVET